MLLAPGDLGLTLGLEGGETVWLLVGGLLVFGGVFAVNSAVHSYLIVAYSDSDKVALNVGFYYMANAAGRLMGTFLSGLLFQWGGLGLALWSSAGLVLLATVLTVPLARPPSPQAAKVN